MSFELVLQALVAVLLVITIVYAVVLNRRLAHLRGGREEMRRVVDEMGAAMACAESGIATLRRTAFEDDEALGRRIAESRTARDEIGFLVDRAESLSARLEAQIGAAREAGRPQPTAPAGMAIGDMGDDAALFADSPATAQAASAAPGAAPDDATARAARATATAWLRSRSRPEPVAAVRGLR